MHLRFTIRDLFWLVLVIGLVLGWMSDNRQKARENNRLQDEIRTADTNAALAQARADIWETRLKEHITGTLTDEERAELQKVFHRFDQARDALSRK